MASIIKVETLQDTAGNNAIGALYLSKGTLKAYCDSQNQTNTINESLNQSSQTDTSGGRKTHNWTSAFGSATYVGMQGMQGNRGSTTSTGRFTNVDGTWTTTAAVIRHGYNPNTVVDDTHASVAFVGVLA